MKGSIVALVTPFQKDGNIDEKAFIELVKWHIHANTDGIVCFGTTGESPSLSLQEKVRLLQLALDSGKGKIPIYAGTGTNSTKTSIDLTKKVKEMGADGALVVVPYYNKPTQKGCIEHFRAIGDVGLPLILYHHPGRTGVTLTLDSFKTLLEHPCIASIKEASGEVSLTRELRKITEKPILTGDDSLIVDSIDAGGDGVISVFANAFPKESKEICDLARSGKIDAAKKEEKRFSPLIKALMLEVNPQPIKYLLSYMGKISPFMRLPLIEVETSTKREIEKAVNELL